MVFYIEVKKLAPTDTKGARIVARIKGESRIVVPYNHALNLAENYREAAEALTQKMLNAKGYAVDTAVLTEYVSTKTGLPVGYGWEG